MTDRYPPFRLDAGGDEPHDPTERDRVATTGPIVQQPTSA